MKKWTSLLAFLVLVPTACGKSSTGPTVTSVSVNPSTASLTALGQTQQFSAAATDGNGNAVSGETVTWTSSDETVATVSGTGLAAAVGVGSAIVTATIAGVSGTASLTVTLPQPTGECADTQAVSLNVGDHTSLDAAGTSTCVLLPSGSSGDRYRVAVIEPSTSTSSDTLHVSLQVTGLGVSAAPPAKAAPSTVEQPPLLSAQQEASLRQSLRVAQATERLHLAMRARERDLVDYMIAQHRLRLPAPRSTLARVAGASSPDKRVFDISTDAKCTTSADKKKTGIRLYESNDLVFYQDSTQNASSPASPADLKMMSDYYSAYGKDMIKAYFGAPPDIDGNGKLIVFISPVVSGNEAAFVWTGDLFSTQDCAASNEGEIIYFSNAIISNLSASSPSYQALATVAHEAKHVVSLYNRLQASVATNTSQFQPSWVEEGTAEVAGEMSSRIAWAATGGPPVGARVTRSDLANAQGGINVTPENYGILLRMARTIFYLSSQPNSLTSTPLGADSASNVYGSGWSFHRWLGDAYGGAGNSPEADSSFFRALTDSTTPPEPDGLQGKTGKSFGQLLEEYVVAVSLTGTGAPEPPLTYTTYNFVSATSNLLKNQTPGIYPWPVTPLGTGFQSGTYAGPIGASGIRIHDFVSNGTGTGALLQLTMHAPSRLIVVRLN